MADTRTLASRLGVKESDIVAMLERFAGAEMSLDAPVRSQDPDARALGDSLNDVSEPGPDRRVEEAEFSRILHSTLEQFGAGLRGREAEIFRRRLLDRGADEARATGASIRCVSDARASSNNALRHDFATISRKSWETPSRCRRKRGAATRQSPQASKSRDASPRTAHSARGIPMMTEMVEPGGRTRRQIVVACLRNSQPMWVVDAMEVVDVNRAALLHYGYSRDEFLALTIDALSGKGPPQVRSRLIRTRSHDIDGRTDRASTWR